MAQVYLVGVQPQDVGFRIALFNLDGDDPLERLRETEPSLPRSDALGVAPGSPVDAAAQQREARALGERLGALVVEAAALASPADDAPVAFVEVAYRPPAIDVRAACAGYLFAPFYYVVARQTLPSESVLAAARLGGLRLLASPYELGVEVAARIRQHVPGPLMLVAHANDWLGYLLEPADFAAGGYESCLAFHGEDAAVSFAERAVQLLEDPALSDPR
jgi:hypothetical protein